MNRSTEKVGSNALDICLQGFYFIPLIAQKLMWITDLSRAGEGGVTEVVKYWGPATQEPRNRPKNLAWQLKLDPINIGI